MKTRILFFLIGFALLFGFKNAGAAAYTWKGTTNTLWSVATNWLPNGHPGAGDDILIPATANDPVVNAASACLSITVTGTTTLTLNAALTVTDGLTLNAALSIPAGAGSINAAGGILLVNSSKSLKIAAGNTLTFGAIILTTAAVINNAAVIISNGTVTIGFQSNITNSGTFNVNGDVDVNLSSHITNSPTGIFSVKGNSKIVMDFASFILNGGTFSINSGSLAVGDSAHISNRPGANFSTNGSIFIDFEGKIINSGTFVANSDTIGIGVSAYINNGATGNFTDSSTVIDMGFKARLLNAGIFKIKKAEVKLGADGQIYNKSGATFTFYRNASIDFASNSAASAYILNDGTFHAGVSNSACTINLNYSGVYIQNTGTFFLGSTSTINLTGFGVRINNLDSFTLQSDAFGCAAIGNITGASASIVGTYAVQRYITGGSSQYRGYRLLSSPVHTANVAGNHVYSLNYVKLSSLVTGTGGVPGGFDTVGNPSLYLYRDNIASSNSSFTSGNFRGVSNISAAPTYSIDVDGGGFNIPIGNGFMFFFRGDRIHNLANKYKAGTLAESVTMTATGTLNTKRVIVKPWFNPASGNLDYTAVAGNSSVLGYALVGNPYPSAIDWDTYNTTTPATGIYAPHVSSFMYILDPVSQNYSVYVAGTGGVGTIAASNANVIPSGQGFFVVAASPAAELFFNESAKTSAQATAANGNLFLGAPPQAAVSQFLHLMLKKDSATTDGIFINFNSSAKPQFAADKDAPYKPGSGLASLSGMSADSVSLAIHTTALPDQKPLVIGLNVNAGADGLYQLNLAAVKSIPDLYDIWLMDAYKKDSLDIKHNPTYSFDIFKGDLASYGSKRFSLVIRQNPALGVHLLNFTAAKVINGAQTVWKTENEQNYTNFTVERSTDGGTTFDILGGLASSALGTYSFLDKSPVTGNNQYRLKIADLNGAISYSNTVTLSYGNSASINASNISVYPNPTGNVINLTINKGGDNAGNGLSALQNAALTPGLNQKAGTQSYDIKIISITGMVVKSATSSSPTWQNNVNNLAPGTYIIQVHNNKDNSLVGKGTFVKL